MSKRTIKPPWTELGTLLQRAVISKKIDYVRCLLELGLVQLLFRLLSHDVVNVTVSNHQHSPQHTSKLLNVHPQGRSNCDNSSGRQIPHGIGNRV